MTLVPGISDAELRALAEKRRHEDFLAMCRTPGAWLDRAMLHKRGADILYELAHKAYARNVDRMLQSSAVAGSVSHLLSGDELEDYHDQRLLSEYLLLVGYALECLLKGYLLAIMPELVETKLDKIVATHDLVALCQDSGLALSTEERDLLKLVSRHIVWGKYVAPMKVLDMPSWILPGDQNEKSLAISNPFHGRRAQVLADSICGRVSDLLRQERARIHALAGQGAQQ